MNRDDTGQTDEYNDRELREAYRSLATERTPEHLDRAVLAEAAAATKRRSSPMIPWRRPLAWAATIALSFALILEFTQTNPDLVPPPPATEADFTQVDEREADVPMKDVADAMPSVASDLDAVEEAIAMPAESREETAAPAIKSEAAKRERMNELEIMSAPQPAAGAVADEQPSPEPADALASPAESELREAARRAEQQVLERQNLPASQALRQSSDQFIELDPGEPICEAKLREAADTWLRCIEALFDGGQNSEAQMELLHYRRAFPDAPLPTRAN